MNGLKSFLVAGVIIMSFPLYKAEASLRESASEDTVVSTVEWTDTIAVIKKAGHAVVTVEGNKALLTVNGSEGNPKFYYRYGIEPKVEEAEAPKGEVGIDIPFAGGISRSSSSVRFLKNIYVGCAMPVGPGKDLKAGVEVGVSEVIGFGYTPNQGKSNFSVGFGFGYSRLNSAHGSIFSVSDGNLILGAPTEGMSKTSSYLSMWRLEFPLLLTQTLNKKTAFNIGVILNLNVSAKAHDTWYLGNEKIKTPVDNLRQRFFTPTLVTTFGVTGCAGVYFKYSPMNSMMHYHGSRISTVAVGVNLNF